MEAVKNFMMVCLPILFVSWGLFIWNTKRKPQRLRNGFGLLNAIFWTLITIACLFGDNMGNALLCIIILVILILLIVPFLLIWNGIVMIKKEGFRLANILSFILGFGVLGGEYAFIFSSIKIYGNEIIPTTNLALAYIGLSALYFCTIILAFVLYSIFVQILPYRKNLDCLIIHGCGLKEDGTVSKILQDRADKAIKVYKQCKEKPHIICSGGQGADEVCSEAYALQTYLLQNGISAQSIILEENSTTTMENLIYSKEIIEQNGFKKIALITSNYHVYRCLVYAKSLGMNCVGIGSRVAFYYWPSALLRECVAIYSKPKKIIWLIGIWLFFTFLFWT